MRTPWAYVFYAGSRFAGACLAAGRRDAADDFHKEMLKRGATATYFFSQADYMAWFERNAIERAAA